MSVIRNSAITEPALRSVSVLIPVNPFLSNPGEERTTTFYMSREAFGNFLMNESLDEPTVNFVEIFLFSDFSTIPATLSCNKNEAVNNIRASAIIKTANILIIL